MAGTSWSKEELNHMMKCLKDSFSVPEATGKHQKKYPHRNVNSLNGQLQARGIRVAGLIKKKSYERIEIVQEKDALKKQIKDLNDQISLLRVESKDTKAILDLIHGVAEKDFTKIPKWLQKTNQRGITGIPFLGLSDIHHGEVVDTSQINFVNSFNRKISRERLEFTFKTCVSLCKNFFNRPKYEGIVCALNGDMISGNIHEELAETNEGTILESVVELTEILIQGITFLADQFGKVYVPCIAGNHGRINRKPRAKNRARDNYEWIIYQWLFKHFEKDDRVNVVIPNGPDTQYSIYGINFLQTHGDQFHGGTGIAGLFSPLMLGLARKQMRQQAIRSPFDVMFIGHWHQYIHTEKLIVNGSVKGMDEYAFGLNLPFEHPKQALFIVHPDHGITYRMPIICDAYQQVDHKKTYKDTLWRPQQK